VSEPIILISSAAISHDELRDFVARQGGETIADAALPEHLNRGAGHLWIGLSTDELATTIDDAGEDYARQLAVLLGGPARSAVTVEMNRAPEAERLALDFALAFAGHWPAVADGYGDDGGPRLATLDTLRQRDATMAPRVG
jgi:hypothetical protein